MLTSDKKQVAMTQDSKICYTQPILYSISNKGTPSNSVFVEQREITVLSFAWPFPSMRTSSSTSVCSL